MADRATDNYWMSCPPCQCIYGAELWPTSGSRASAAARRAGTRPVAAHFSGSDQATKLRTLSNPKCGRRASKRGPGQKMTCPDTPDGLRRSSRAAVVRRPPSGGRHGKKIDSQALDRCRGVVADHRRTWRNRSDAHRQEGRRWGPAAARHARIHAGRPCPGRGQAAVALAARIRRCAAGPAGDRQGQGLGGRSPDHRPRRRSRPGGPGARAHRYGRPRREADRADGRARVREGAGCDGREESLQQQRVAEAELHLAERVRQFRIGLQRFPGQLEVGGSAGADPHGTR